MTFQAIDQMVSIPKNTKTKTTLMPESLHAYKLAAESLHKNKIEIPTIVGVPYSLAIHNLFRSSQDTGLLRELFKLLDVDDSLISETPCIRQALTVEHAPLLNEVVKIALHPECRKNLGSYYTPFETTARITALVKDSIKNNPDRILDPAVGGGIFLVSALSRFSASGTHNVYATAKRLHGFDVDQTAIVAARASITCAAVELAGDGNLQLALNSLHENRNNFILADALFEDWCAPDVVMSNPPYLRVRDIRRDSPGMAEKVMQEFASAVHSWDIYMPFVEKGIKSIARGGVSAMLVPIQFLHQDNAMGARQTLFANGDVRHIVDFSNGKQFSNALVRTCAVIATKPSTPELASISAWLSTSEKLNPVGEVDNDLIRSRPKFSLKLSQFTDEYDQLMAMQKRSHKLSDLCYVTFGLRSCAPGKGQGGKERLIVSESIGEDCRPYLEGREIKRYSRPRSTRWIRYLPKEMYSARRPELFDAPKIISQTMLSGKRIVSTLDYDKHYVEQSLACIIPHGIMTTAKVDVPSYPLEYILACLNSTAQSRWFAGAVIDDSLGGGLIHATPGAQGQLLIPTCDHKTALDIAADVKALIMEENSENAELLSAAIDVRISSLFGI